MREIGIVEAANKDTDGGHATENGGAGFGLSLLLERQFVADVHMRIEDARQNGLA